MATPTPVIAEAPYVQIANTGAATYSVTLDGSGSLHNAGGWASSGAWQWSLVSSSLGLGATLATLSGDTTDTCTVSGLVAGESVLVMLKVKNDAGEESHAYPYPVQKSTAPYDFDALPSTGMVAIAVATAKAGLVTTPEYDRGWAPRSYYPAIMAIEDHEGRIESLETTTAGLVNTGAGVPATTATIGSVKLGATPVDANAPVVQNYREVVLSGVYHGALVALSAGSSPIDSTAHVALFMRDAADLVDVVGVLRNRGNTGSTLTVKVYLMTPAQYAANDFASATELNSLTWAKSSSLMTASRDYSPQSVPADTVIAFVRDDAADIGAKDLTVSARLRVAL